MDFHPLLGSLWDWLDTKSALLSNFTFTIAIEKPHITNSGRNLGKIQIDQDDHVIKVGT